MAILYKDPKYEYTYQLSLWLKNVRELQAMLKPFTAEDGHAVVRCNKYGEYAVFTKAKATERKRYKLEVVLGCKCSTLLRPVGKRAKTGGLTSKRR